MKMILTLIVALVIGMRPAASGFTLDAVGYEGGGLRASPLSMWVAGYGEVVFESELDTALVVHSAYQNDLVSELPELGFQPHQAVRIVFKGLGSPASGGATAEGSTAHISEIRNPPPAPDARFATLDDQTTGAAEAAAAIPETASGLLGMLGVLLLFLRRGR